ncbi:MAG: transposase, partial [Acetobacteraceae bacterium]|nr:transposase [Acetobacteraceae bacterium]
MEIITGIERRRHWRPEEKLRILAELAEPGVKFNDVARRHDLSRGLLWQWRDAWRRGKLVVAEAEPAFVPLRVVPELPAPPEARGAAAPPAPDAESAGEPDDRIEIVPPDGTAVRVPETIGTTALR